MPEKNFIKAILAGLGPTSESVKAREYLRYSLAG